MVNIGNNWDIILQDEFKSEYYLQLRSFLKYEYAHYNVFPSMYDIFNALKYTDYFDVKVVIIGQDPYHEINQAHGLCFSVQDNVAFPPSLQNIFLELKNDLGYEIPKSGNLTKWARQGVLLLNTVLTVREHYANSHKGHGWETLTTNIIKKLNARNKPIIFVLWGNDAKQKRDYINNPIHIVLTSSHPSPYSVNYGFFGCRHFSKINEYLINNKQKPIDWNLNE